jgi:hypothetical protein
VVRLLMIAALACHSTGMLCAEENTKIPPSDEQVSQWIAQLSANRFQQREDATEALLHAGGRAIEQLGKSIAGKDLEVVQRVIGILKEVVVGGEDDDGKIARVTLETIALSNHVAAQRRASATLLKLNQLREDRAIARLKSLGAKVTVRSNIELLSGINPFGSSPVVSIGEDWKGGREGIADLQWLINYPVVRLTGKQVTDDWLEPVGRMPRLQFLTLNRTRVSDAGLQHLKETPNLQSMLILYSPITLGAAEILKEQPKLRVLKLYGTDIKHKDRAQMKTQLAGLVLDIRAGALLGIAGSLQDTKCVVGGVRPGSAASAAGLETHDVIVAYRNEQVNNFESLTEKISTNKPGDVVSIQIRRYNQLLKKQVTLGEWKLP